MPLCTEFKTEFNAYVEIVSIVYETTWYSPSVDTPSQNGVVERKNRHLLQTARALLLQMKVPKQFWADVVSTTCFVINHMSSSVLAGNVPYNVMFTNKSLFQVEPKIFESTCYVQDV